jgi:hypothetical protein
MTAGVLLATAFDGSWGREMDLRVADAKWLPFSFK